MPSETIQWFPGHMAKTKRVMKECLGDVDIVIELLDARIPQSSENPQIDELCAGKPILTIANKSSLADEKISAEWAKYYKSKGRKLLFIDCVSGAGVGNIMPAIKSILAEKIERYEAKGMSGRKLRAMVVGIPNVGKSSFINRLAGGKKARTEDRPGVTLTKQWVPTSIGLDLLDMPGVLWPKFEDKTVGENLALTGAIRDAILDTEMLAIILCSRLRIVAPDALAARYKLGEYEKWSSLSDRELFEYIGKKRGFLISGGEIDTERTATVLLDEFRGAKIGKITLERPEKEVEQ